MEDDEDSVEEGDGWVDACSRKQKDHGVFQTIEGHDNGFLLFFDNGVS